MPRLNEPAPSTPQNKPRKSYSLYQSPVNAPSLSSSVPFDWRAASTPASKRKPPRQSLASASPAGKAYVRKKSWYQRMKSLPDEIAFQIAVFPNNITFPQSKTSAKIIGGLLHALHFIIRLYQLTNASDSDAEWEKRYRNGNGYRSNVAWDDMYRKGPGESWFDWTVPLTCLLLAVSFGNAVYLFTRIRIYRLHQRHDPVSSPNAKFVSSQLDFDPLDVPSISSRLSAGLWQAFLAFWRFLLGWKSSASSTPSRKETRVQQLEVWTPGELETMVFCIYSPAHSLLWLSTTYTNWVVITLVMVTLGFQLHTLARSYNTLIKDKEIIAAEVLNEYNQNFVYPRVLPVRKDASTMTHESEVVNVWKRR